MLDRLLQIVAQGGAYSYADLTGILDVSEEFLHQMIEDLAQMGYLKAIGESCQAKCEECPASGVCAVGGRGKVWSLTQKGSRVAPEPR